MTTLRLAKAVGVTQLAIFRHFPTKQDIWLAVADHIAEAMTAAWDAVLDRNVPPQERLVALLQVQLGQIAAILHSRELHVENAALMTRFQTLFVEPLSNGQKSGVFRSDLAPQDAEILLISQVQGLAIRWSLGQRAFSLEVEGARLVSCQMALFKHMKPLEKTT